MSFADEYPEQFKTNGWFKDVIPQELTLRGYTVYPRNAEDIYPDGKRVCVIYPKFKSDSWEVSNYKCVVHQADFYVDSVGDTPEKCLYKFLFHVLLEEFHKDNAVPHGTYFKDWLLQNSAKFQPGTVQRFLQNTDS